MSRDDDEAQAGFLSRWSRRKAEARQAGGTEPVPAPAVKPPVEAVVPPVGPLPVPAEPPRVVGAEPVETPPPPTLDEVAALGKDSDYRRFVAPDVAPEVKNAALKKLFASDPHFNVMDGLDIYIDDYNKHEPLPRSMLRQLVSARVLGLLDDELEAQPAPDNPAPHDDQDASLQLQPDDAAGRPVAGQSDDPPDPVPPRSA